MIQLAGVHEPRAGRAADRQDRAARVLRPRGRSHRPLGHDLRIRASPRRDRQPLQPALGPAGARRNRDAERVLPLRQEQAVDRRAVGHACRDCSTRALPECRRAGRSSPFRPSTTVDHVHGDARTARARPATPRSGRPSTTSSSTTRRTRTKKRIPEMTGAELKSPARRRTSTRAGQPVVRLAFTGKGSEKFQRITHEPVPARAALAGAAAVRDRPRPRDQVVPADRLHGPVVSPTASAAARRSPDIGKFGEAKDLAIVLQTGALPYEFNQLEQLERLGDARQGLAEAGEAAARDRPARRRDLPAARLPLPRRRRRARPRHLRRLPLRRDPPPQRDADAAGLRRD